MSQHDFDIATADANTGSTVRAAINAALQALASLSAGATAPSTTYANQIWVDTANSLIKKRNNANSAWVTIGAMDTAFIGLLSLATAQTITAQHTIAPGSDMAPFVLGAHAQNQKVTGLEADRLDGYDATGTPTGSKIPVADANGKLDGWVTPSSVRDATRGLVIKNNVTNPTYQLTITADEIVMQDTNGAPLRATAFSKTADITASGANGLDTGTEANSTWYHIWAIGKADGTVNSLLSVSTTAPTMPSGYTFKAYLGAVRNNSSGNFQGFYQRGNIVAALAYQLLAAGTETSATDLSLAPYVPTTARRVAGYAYIDDNSTNQIHLRASTSIGIIADMSLCRVNSSLQQQYQQFTMPNFDNQIAYYNENAGGATTLYINGWEY